MATRGLLPSFLMPGKGTTILRQFVLGAAIIQFAVSTVIFRCMYARSRLPFLQWFSLGLTLLFIGLAGVWLTTPGTPLNWTARCAQFLAGPYILMAILAVKRRAGGWRISLENALRESEERYRLLFESMSEGFSLHEIVCDENGKPVDYRFLDINPAFERMTGLKRANVIGRRVLEVLPHTEPYWIENYGKVAITGEPMRFEKSSAVLNRWFEAFAFRPALNQFAVVFTDITERKRIEQVALDSEARFRALFENMQDGVAYCQMVLDDENRPADFIYLAVNSAFGRLTGLENVVGKRATEVLPGIRESHPELLETYGRVARTGQPERLEINFKPLAMWLTIAVYSPQQGYFAAVFDNITERKRAEEALRESEERLRLAQSNANVGVWDWRPPSGLLKLAPEFEALYGLAPGTIKTYQDWRSRVHPDDIVRIEAERDTAIAKRQPFDLEFRILHNSGQVRWIAAKGKATYTQTGEILRVTGINLDITDKKRAEKELCQSQEDLERAQAVGNIGNWRLNVKRNELLWSDENHRIFGIPKGTPLTYEIFLSTVHPDDRDYVDKNWKAGMAGEDYDIEHRIVVDGKVKWVREKAFLEFDKKGILLAGFGITQDITERKQAEANQALLTDILQIFNRGGDLHPLIAQTLRLIRKATGFDAVGLRLRQGADCPYFEHNGFSQEFLREENFLCERGGDGAIVRDAEGRVVLECTCGLVLSGRTDPRMTCFTEGGSFWTNVSSELLALSPEADLRTNPRNRCIHDGYESVGLFPIRAGQEITGLLQLNDRRVGRFTPELISFYEALAQNIGLALQRTMAEEALRESEEWFRSLAEALPQIVWTANADGGFDWFNRRWYEYTGEQEGAGEGWSWDRVAHPDDRAQTLKKWVEARLTGRLFQIDIRVRRHDGEYRWFLVRAWPLRDGDGNVVRWFGTNTDIHDLKQAEEILARDKETFERLVKERTEELLAARMELERAKRLSDIGALAATVAHELRNPLAAIKMASYNISRKSNDPVLSKHLINIEKKVTESDQIISNLLFYSRLRMPHYESFDIYAILDDSVTQAAAFREEITFRRDYAALKNVEIEADSLQMRELFTNVLNNACDAASAKPGGSVKVSARVRQKDNVFTVRVTDSGAAIEKDHLDKVFDPFFTTKTKGTGLGLTVAQQIVKMHGGHIKLESSRKSGTSAVIDLPIKRQNHSREMPAGE
ncbi:MAG: PAS domain S-box protein [Candidatus Aureabacteria bacterium]|nr:PAS domain S-box protein [Candidatus Auribacterota bacterium]